MITAAVPMVMLDYGPATKEYSGFMNQLQLAHLNKKGFPILAMLPPTVLLRTAICRINRLHRTQEEVGISAPIEYFKIQV